MTVEDVYAAWLERCTPFEPPSPWPAKGDRHAFRGPSDPEAALAALRETFPREMLNESGLVRDDGERPPLLAQPVSNAASVFVALREPETGATHELLTAAGCLRRDEPAAAAVLRDEPTRRRLTGFDDCLGVATTIEDVVALRSVGVPATLATGLADLGGRALEAYGPLFGLRPPEPGTRTVQPMLVDWSPAQLGREGPPEIAVVRAHLVRLERELDVSVDDVGVWRLDERRLESLCFRLRHGRAKDVRRGLRESLASAEGVVPLEGPAARLTGAPTDYVTAVALLREVRARGDDGRPVHGDDRLLRGARANLEAALEREVVGPLEREALAVTEPKLRDALLAQAEISRLFHREAVRLGTSPEPEGTAELERRAARERDLLRLTDRLVKAAGVVHRAARRDEPPPPGDQP